MPSYPVALLLVGIVLLLVGLVGKVKAKELEVGTSNKIARIVTGSIGVVLVVLSFGLLGIAALQIHAPTHATHRAALRQELLTRLERAGYFAVIGVAVDLEFHI